MYAKILKENASGLRVLAVEFDNTSCDTINKNLKRFFKNITYVSNSDEALFLHRNEKIDLILVDIDTFDGKVDRFINKVYRHDIFQAVAIYGSCIDDAALMLKLINSQITCFIPKTSKANTMHEILSRVCTKINERAVLMHYIETLEGQQANALEVSCQSACPIKIELKPIPQLKQAQPQQTVKPMMEEDDFMFFPEPVTASSTASEDTSIYKDYFTYLESDDYEELHDQLGDIDASLLNAFSENGGDPQFITSLGNSLMRYGNVLLHYQFFSDMGTAILELGKIISDNAEMISERSGDFQMLISGFCSGLQTFMAEVWEKNSDNPKFFNDSIVNDSITIVAMMEPSQGSGSENEDIFFF